MSNQHPRLIDLEPGTYYWCSCGRTKTPGFCDGSHKGTSKQPQQFSVTEKKTAAVCNCGRTKTPPYCDGAHEKK